MKDEFEATFVVELAADAVWEALTSRTVSGDADDGVHYVLPGFTSLVPLDVAGASFRLIEQETGRLLRVKKDHEPCAGTEVAIRLEQAAIEPIDQCYPQCRFQLGNSRSCTTT